MFLGTDADNISFRDTDQITRYNLAKLISSTAGAPQKLLDLIQL